MAHHSSTLAWKIPWTEEPGGLQSMGSLSRTRLSNFTFTFHFHALEKEMATPFQCSCLENPRDGGAWWAAIYGVAQSRTGLKRLSSSSSSSSTLSNSHPSRGNASKHCLISPMGSNHPLLKTTGLWKR